MVGRLQEIQFTFLKNISFTSQLYGEIKAISKIVINMKVWHFPLSRSDLMIRQDSCCSSQVGLTLPINQNQCNYPKIRHLCFEKEQSQQYRLNNSNFMLLVQAMKFAYARLFNLTSLSNFYFFVMHPSLKARHTLALPVGEIDKARETFSLSELPDLGANI